MFDRMAFILNISEHRNITDEQLEDIATEMVHTSRQTQHSPTFRKGLTGEWRTYFNDSHKALFKELDEDDWLMSLGYEKDKDW